jgi:hypothetical protein
MAGASSTKDPLRQLERLSWPITASVHTSSRGQKRILILGDQHRSLRGACGSCEPPSCANVNELLHALIDWSAATGRDLDVFAEMRLVPERTRRGRAAQIRRMEKRYEENYGTWVARARQRILETVRLEWLFGKHPGYLVEVFYEFRHRFLHVRDQKDNARFHYADGRVETLMEKLNMDLFALFRDDEQGSRLKATIKFYQTYESVKHLERVLLALCFSKRADVDIPKIMSTKKQARSASKIRQIKHHPLIRNGMYKIAKQVHKLPPAERSSLRKFAKDLLARDILQLYSRQGDDRKDNQLSPGTIAFLNEMHFKRLKESLLSLSGPDQDSSILKEAHAFAQSLLLAKTLVLMDVYLLARMLYYVRRQAPGSTTVIFAGDIHAENYRDFIAMYLGRDEYESRVCSERKELPRFRDLIKTDRCVPTDKCTA